MKSKTKQTASSIVAWVGKYFWLLIMLGIIIRLILSGVSALNNDIKVWYDLARQMYDHVPIYAYKNFSYPPGAALVFVPAIKIISAFSSPSSWGYFDPALEVIAIKTAIYHPLITSPLFNFAVKIPLFIAEGLMLYAMYCFFRKKIQDDKLKTGIVLFYLNPLVIFVSAVHAQFDIYPVFLSLLSILLLLDKKYFFSGAVIAMAIATKLYPLLFVPLLLIAIVTDKGNKRRIKTVLQFLTGFAVPLAAVAYYAYFNPEMIVSVFSRFKTIGLEGSLNILTLVYIPPIGRFGQSHAEIIGQIVNIFLLLCPIIIYSMFFITLWKHPKSDKLSIHIFSASVLVLSAVYLFSARTNPTYALWILPSLIILYLHNASGLLSYWLLSLAALSFYFAVYFLSWKSYLLPAAGYLHWFKVSEIASDAMQKFQYPGIVNVRLSLDIFLLCGLVFVTSLMLSCLQAVRNLRQ